MKKWYQSRMQVLGLLIALYGLVPTLAGFFGGSISWDGLMTALLGALIMYLRYDTSTPIEKVDLNTIINKVK